MKKKSLNTAHDHNSANTNNIHSLGLPREIFLAYECIERNVMRPQILRVKKIMKHIFLTSDILTKLLIRPHFRYFDNP